MQAASILERRGTRTRVADRATVFHEGDAAGVVYGVLAGQVRIEVSTPSGGRLVLALKEPGDLVGELAALDGRPRSASAVAVGSVELVQMGVDDFLSTLREEPDLAIELLQRLSGDLRASVQRTTHRASADTTKRVALLLVDLAERCGEHDPAALDVELSMTQDDLAGWIGATREATARALRTLRERGCVATGRGRISIVDLPGLRGVAAA